MEEKNSRDDIGPSEVDKMQQNYFRKIAIIATTLALFVVVLGAYVRLSDAGLGCPDWPGCYGHFTVPEAAEHVSTANEAYPERPVEAAKAWKEMIHRYFASTLGLLIVIMAILGWKNKRISGQQFRLPLFLVGLVIFQGLLGMWTVTIKLNPTIVMSHLIGGMTTLSLLWWVTLRQGKIFTPRSFYPTQLRPFQGIAAIGLIIVAIQIMLGGWTSSNYAALVCADFPTCQGFLIPPTDFAEAFDLWRGTEINFEGGVLDNTARVTIHFVHRVGALVTFLFIGWLGLKLITGSEVAVLRKIGRLLLFVLFLQIALGISNVLFSLPLFVAVAHNGVGALLLLTMVALNHAVSPPSQI